MTCCGHALHRTRREWMWSTLLTTAAAIVAGCAGARPETPAAATAEMPYPAAAKLLREHVSVDVHTHAGPNGVTSRTAAPSDDLARSMRAGRIAVLCLADVPDGPILGRDASNVLRALREPEPGFLYQYHLQRLGWVDELCAKHGIRRVLTTADVKAAHAAGAPAIIMDIEGLDFLERKLERLEESYQRGVRTISSSTTPRTTSATSRPVRSPTTGSPRSGPTSSAPAIAWAWSSTWPTPPPTP